MKLYDYFRSSAAYRIRIALNLKGIDYRQIPVDLLRGDDREAAYRAVNPQGLVPALDDGDTLITQSVAICEYLEETHPEPPLLPGDSRDRARIRAIALMVACDIHPLNNLRVLARLTGALGVDEERKLAWYRHWIEEGFRAIETLLQRPERNGPFCHGDRPTMADLFLIPQLYNARRFDVDLAPYPDIRAVEAACSEIEAFERARPEHQPDAR
ncbi:MAG TPA: maleylacetoacetate isomerase [Sedimenticola thiotaurini]|uniref:Maleylacetoacetate isomerase n=1 Tax=Sedimenticola thiotaurini TaxID=1543721 RepID=A0A831RK19_9GAMM|nr:maleylacetoacetate isomerase [Sedimenticola thiotaurini]